MINPGTTVSQILPIINAVDYVLIMTVNPGFGGQSFIEDCVDKVLELNTLKNEKQLTFDIEVDGGINAETAEICVKNGAKMLVTGSYFFKQDDYQAVTQNLKG